jgi:hypothetical protein
LISHPRARPSRARRCYRKPSSSSCSAGQRMWPSRTVTVNQRNNGKMSLHVTSTHNEAVDHMREATPAIRSLSSHTNSDDRTAAGMRCKRRRMRCRHWNRDQSNSAAASFFSWRLMVRLFGSAFATASAALSCAGRESGERRRKRLSDCRCVGRAAARTRDNYAAVLSGFYSVFKDLPGAWPCYIVAR